MSETYVALLRGLNVGGKNRLSMKDLAGVFVEAGCQDVRTYIQSGNVVFTLADDQAAGLAAEVSQRLLQQTGLRLPLVLRSRAELADAVQRNPFLASGADPAALHVMFLADWPSEGATAGLDPHRSPPDVYAVVGREIYLHCPEGLARTKLTNAYFDSKLGTLSTGRNWRTTLTLLEMANGEGPSGALAPTAQGRAVRTTR